MGGLPKQTRFATAMAINQTAKEVQSLALGKLLPGAFTLRARGRPWQAPGQKYGFNIRPRATREKLEATIGSQADWLKEQEAGGTKTGRGHRVAIPSTLLKPKPALMRRELKPGALLASRLASLQLRKAGSALATHSARIHLLHRREAQARSSSRRSVRALAQDIRAARHELERDRNRLNRTARKAATRSQRAARTVSALKSARPFLYEGGKMAKGIYVRAGRGRLPLLKLFTLRESVGIKGILHFEPKGAALANEVFDRHFARAFALALATAK